MLNKITPFNYFHELPVLDYLQSLKGHVLEDSPSPLSVWHYGRLTDMSLGKASMEYIVRI
jgi:hypothetical protein